MKYCWKHLLFVQLNIVVQNVIRLIMIFHSCKMSGKENTDIVESLKYDSKLLTKVSATQLYKTKDWLLYISIDSIL